VKLIDLGTQHGEYQGQPTRRNQVLVVWELPEEMITINGEDKPVTTSRFYTNSLSEKANLRADLESWRGRGFTEPELDRFDLQSVLGKPCMLNIIDKGNNKTKVASIMPMPKNMVCPPQVNESVAFWLEEFDDQVFDSLSDGIKKIIEKSEEYPQIANGAHFEPRQQEPPEDYRDDVPF